MGKKGKGKNKKKKSSNYAKLPSERPQRKKKKKNLVHKDSNWKAGSDDPVRRSVEAGMSLNPRVTLSSE